MSEWTDIGEQLREAREAKDLDLRDVAHATRIPLTTLEALEESNYSIFPSPTYARSFLSQYSEFLEVDAHDWIDAFETGNVLSNVNDHGYLQDDHDHIGDPASQRSNTTTRNPSRKNREEKHARGSSSILQTLTVFLVTIALVAGGIYIYRKYEPMLAKTLPGNTEKDNTVGPSTGSDQPNSAQQTPPPTPAKIVDAPPPPPAQQNSGTNQTASNTLKPQENVTPKPRIGPPPKALVIDENDE